MRHLLLLLIFSAALLADTKLEKAVSDICKALPERSRKVFEETAKKNSMTCEKVVESMLRQYTGQLAMDLDPAMKKRAEAAKAAQESAKQAALDLEREFEAVFPPNQPKEKK
jgi:hypothetical protein